MTDNPYIDKATGHRERIKFAIHFKTPTTEEGIKNWHWKLRSKLYRFTFGHVGSHCDCTKTYPDADKWGVPYELFSTNAKMFKFFNEQFTLSENVEYQVFGQTHKKTKTKIGFSKCWLRFRIIDKEKQIYEVYKDAKIKRYWFRKQENNKDE